MIKQVYDLHAVHTRKKKVINHTTIITINYTTVSVDIRQKRLIGLSIWIVAFSCLLIGRFLHIHNEYQMPISWGCLCHSCAPQYPCVHRY